MNSVRKQSRRDTMLFPAHAWVIALLMGISTCLVMSRWVVMAHGRLRAAESAYAAGELPEALRLAESELSSRSDTARPLLIAGLAAAGMKQYERAMRYLAQIPQEQNQATTEAIAAIALMAMKQGRVTMAERFLRQVLEFDTGRSDVRDRLIFLLFQEGRTWEAQQHVLSALQSGQVDSNYLILTGSNKVELGNIDQLAGAPGELFPLLAQARHAYRYHDVDHARVLLEQISANRPEILESQGLLGAILADGDDVAEFSRWHDRLPANADDHPGVWYARGVWVAKAGQREGAVRCFAEVLRRQPCHVGANHQMSQALSALGQEAEAVEFGKRTRDLVQVERTIGRLAGGWDTEEVGQLVQLLESMGRIWEAAATDCHLTTMNAPTEKWSYRTLLRLQPILIDCRTLMLDSANPTSRMDLTNYPLPSWTKRSESDRPSRASGQSGSSVVFTEEARTAGLNFTYHNVALSGDSESMFEFDGGGVAILDYDGDHWPDIYLTQGGLLPTELGVNSYPDRLFRNVAGERFLDVTGIRKDPGNRLAIAKG